LQNSPAFYMKVKSKERLTSPECEDVVIKLVMEPLPDKILPTFICGQYTRLGLPGLRHPSPSYYAIATEPEQTDCFEFFIKRTDGISRLLSDLDEGAIVTGEGPMGKGYDLNKLIGRDIYLIGVGTGISPLRSVWRSIIRKRDRFDKVFIYAGFLTPLHRLLTDEFESLSNHDIQVNVSVALGKNGWEGPIGYVQEAIQADAPNGSHATACLAGMSAMVDACHETLQNLGFNDRYILLNH